MSATNETAAKSEKLSAKDMSTGFTVNDVERSLRFYMGLGFDVADKHEMDGKVVFYMLKAGAAHLGIGQDDWAKGRDRVKGVGMRIWLTTDQDIEALAARAKAAGITLDSGPEPLEWGPMAFTVTDPDGFKLTISHSD